MQISTFFNIIILKVKANEIEKTAIKTSDTVTTCNQLSDLPELVVSTAGVGPQDQVFANLATETYHVVKILKLQYPWEELERFKGSK